MIIDNIPPTDASINTCFIFCYHTKDQLFQGLKGHANHNSLTIAEKHRDIVVFCQGIDHFVYINLDQFVTCIEEHRGHRFMYVLSSSGLITNLWLPRNGLKTKRTWEHHLLTTVLQAFALPHPR